VIAGAAIWGTWHMLNRSVDKAKTTAGGNVATVQPGANPANVATPPSARAGQQPQRMTKDEWIAQHKPRLSDFPNTAPKYDEVTKPAVAPYPAACIAMKDKCECFTQQGTRLPGTSVDVCQQIVANGYFVDWALPEPREPAPMPARSEAPRARLVSAPAPGAAPVQTEDAEYEQWKKQNARLAEMNNLALHNAATRNAQK